MQKFTCCYVYDYFCGMRKKNDILLKSAFEEAFPDLLRFFFEDADAAFNMSRDLSFWTKNCMSCFRNWKSKAAAVL